MKRFTSAMAVFALAGAASADLTDLDMYPAGDGSDLPAAAWYGSTIVDLSGDGYVIPPQPADVNNPGTGDLETAEDFGEPLFTVFNDDINAWAGFNFVANPLPEDFTGYIQSLPTGVDDVYLAEDGFPALAPRGFGGTVDPSEEGFITIVAAPTDADANGEQDLGPNGGLLYTISCSFGIDSIDQQNSPQTPGVPSDTLPAPFLTPVTGDLLNFTMVQIGAVDETDGVPDLPGLRFDDFGGDNTVNIIDPLDGSSTTGPTFIDDSDLVDALVNLPADFFDPADPLDYNTSWNDGASRGVVRGIPVLATGGSELGFAVYLFSGFDQGSANFQVHKWDFSFDVEVVSNNPVEPPCSPVDYAEPFGTLDLFDILQFFVLFGEQDPAANLFIDPTIEQQWNLFDILAFFDLFGQGCTDPGGVLAPVSATPRTVAPAMPSLGTKN